MIRKLEPGEFAQGTLFTCGLSDSYPDVPALGLLITARCDTAQDKAAVYNYLPVVPVENWIKKDGLEIVSKRVIANEQGALKSALNDAGWATSIIDLIDHKEIIAELKKGSTKQQKAIAQRFEKSSLSCHVARLILQNDKRTECESLNYLNDNESVFKSVVKELMTNSIADFHYLDRSQVGESSRGYVALMREIRFITADVGKRISTGLDADELDGAVPSFSSSLNHIRFCKVHSFAMPISGISSPYIELIMQRFASLFSRIGVADVPKDKLADAQSWIKVMRGELK